MSKFTEAYGRIMEAPVQPPTSLTKDQVGRVQTNMAQELTPDEKKALEYKKNGRKPANQKEQADLSAALEKAATKAASGKLRLQ